MLGDVGISGAKDRMTDGVWIGDVDGVEVLLGLLLLAITDFLCWLGVNKSRFTSIELTKLSNTGTKVSPDLWWPAWWRSRRTWLAAEERSRMLCMSPTLDVVLATEQLLLSRLLAFGLSPPCLHSTGSPWSNWPHMETVWGGGEPLRRWVNCSWILILQIQFQFSMLWQSMPINSLPAERLQTQLRTNVWI